MSNKIILKKSVTASKVPLLTDLDYGELAINYNDGKLYYKKSDGVNTANDTISSISSNGSSTSVSISTTSPATPSVGSLWWDSNYGNLKIYYNDGDTYQWVDAFSTLVGGSGGGGGSGTVTSVSMTVPTGLSITGSPITSSGTLALTLTTGYSIPTTASQTNWDTAYADRNKWDGGATGLTAATGRTSLGASTVGSNLFTLVNPTAITFLRINADNTVSTLDAATFRTAIGAGTSSTTGTVTSVAAITITTTGTDITSSVATGTTTPVITLNVPTASATNRGLLSSTDWSTFNGKTSNVGTVTSVSGTGTVAGLTLTGSVTVSGNLTLGGTLSTPVSTINDSTTVGQNLVKLTNPTAITFLRINADNTVSALDAATFRTAIGAGSGGSGTVTSVGGTGTVNGLTLTGTITTSGSLTLGGTLDLSSPPAIGGSTPAAATFTNLTVNNSFSATSASLITPAISAATYSTNNALVAGTNAQGQGAITTDNVIVITTTANPSGVTLPTATTGRMIVITNRGTNPINVYPATGGQIDALGANVAINIPVNGWMEFNAGSGTQWYSTLNANINTTALIGTIAVSAGGTGATSSGGAIANIFGYTTTVTAAGTTTLTASSTPNQYFSGTTTQTVVLPAVSTLAIGWEYHIVNESTAPLTVNSSGGNIVDTMFPGECMLFTCILTTGTTAASWAQESVGQAAYSVGYLEVPQNAQAGAYSITYNDTGKHLYHAVGSAAATYTIPANTAIPFPIGTAITFVNMATTAVTIAITTDTMYLAGTGTTGSRTLAQFGTATALKTNTTEWVISGTNLT